MGRILCPTRGGEGSYRTQDAAIAMARERGDELMFLYVVDLDFLNKTECAVRPDVVAQEMSHLGEFLLIMAQERAHKQGVEAGYVLREGDARAEEDAESAFAADSLLKFAEEIEAETGIETRVVG